MWSHIDWVMVRDVVAITLFIIVGMLLVSLLG
jgi:hypothetical protein